MSKVKPKGQRGRLQAASKLPDHQRRWWSFRFGEGRMEPSYSVWADWLSKFQTSPEGVQALWVLGLTMTALGLIAGATRVLVAFARIFAAGASGRGGWRCRSSWKP